MPSVPWEKFVVVLCFPVPGLRDGGHVSVGVLRRSFCRSVVLKLHPAEQHHHHDRRDDG